MKQIQKILTLVTITVAVVFSVVSCIGVDTVAREMGHLLAEARGSDADEPAEQPSETGGDGKEADDGDSLFAGMLMDATGMTAMQDYMVAMSVYANAFYAGGFVYGYNDFKEGEGVVWRVSSRDNDDETVVQVERALLKKESSGSWWRLCYESEDGSFHSEAFIDANYELRIFRYEDPDRNEIREWRAEMAGGDDTREKAEVEATVDESQPEFFTGDYESYLVGSDTVTVPAGRFTADHIRIAEDYGDKSGRITYEWWLSADVPGRLVKYDWRDTAEGAELQGELVEFRSDYDTQLNSF